MTVLLYLIPIAIALGLTGLGAFLWSLRTGQYEDLDGAALRVLADDDLRNDTPPARRRNDGTATLE
jgi:cbb3-type cytochrome oxidase maturation protein